MAAEKIEKVRVKDGHAVNLGNRKKPDVKCAGEIFDLPKGKADELAKAGIVEIVKTKEESTSGS